MTTLGSLPARLLGAALRELMRLSTRRAGLVLVYHALATQPGDPARELVAPHATSRFASHLRHLTSHYRLVRLVDLDRAVETRRRGERFPVAITFDDDLASHVELAAPMLRRAEAPATFFLCGASLAGPHPFWWQRLQAAVAVSGEEGDIHEIAERIESMTPTELARVESDLPAGAPEPGVRSEQVRELTEWGFDIGFHTLRHRTLTVLDDASLRQALEEGREPLEHAAGRKLTAIAYPHGKADDRVARAARAAGFVVGVTGRYEAVGPESDPMLLGRIEPTHGADGRFALQLARGLLRRPHT